MDEPFRSSRLIYRAIEDTPEDDDFIHCLQVDPQSRANSNASLLRPQTKQSSSKFKSFLAEKTLLTVIICLAPSTVDSITSPIPIGFIALRNPEPGQEHHRNSNIGVKIIAQYQSQGYGTEAIRWVLHWGFQTAGLHRIGVDCFSWNEGARRLYERLGFVLEGSHREALWHNGGWHDFLHFSILEDEWRSMQKHGL